MLSKISWMVTRFGWRRFFLRRSGGRERIGTGRGRLDLVGEIGVEFVGVEEFGARVFVVEEFVALFISLADAGDVTRQGARGRVLGVEILRE